MSKTWQSIRDIALCRDILTVLAGSGWYPSRLDVYLWQCPHSKLPIRESIHQESDAVHTVRSRVFEMPEPRERSRWTWAFQRRRHPLTSGVPFSGPFKTVRSYWSEKSKPNVAVLLGGTASLVAHWNKQKISSPHPSSDTMEEFYALRSLHVTALLVESMVTLFARNQKLTVFRRWSDSGKGQMRYIRSFRPCSSKRSNARNTR